jgi:RsiW-degrading membrane proteinase PrsW (M82 family)
MTGRDEANGEANRNGTGGPPSADGSGDRVDREDWDPGGGRADDADSPDVDRYEVTDWEVRSALDRAAVTVYRTLLSRWGAIAIVVAVLLLLGEFALAGVVLASNPAVAVLAVLSAVPALAVFLAVRRLDRRRPEPLSTLAVTFVLGAVLASIAAVFNTPVGEVFGYVPIVGQALFFFLFVGPIEETVKWLAVRLYAYPRPEFDAVIDGAVYGAVAGLGFATIENAVFVVQGLLQASSTGAPAFQAAVTTATVRSLAGPGHVLYSAFAGYYLGLAKAVPEHRGPLAVKGLLVAALLHGFYNTAVTFLPAVTGSRFATLAFIPVFLVVVLWVLYRKLSHHCERANRLSRATAGDGRAAGSSAD